MSHTWFHQNVMLRINRQTLLSSPRLLKKLSLRVRPIQSRLISKSKAKSILAATPRSSQLPHHHHQLKMMRIASMERTKRPVKNAFQVRRPRPKKPPLKLKPLLVVPLLLQLPKVLLKAKKLLLLPPTPPRMPPRPQLLPRKLLPRPMLPLLPTLLLRPTLLPRLTSLRKSMPPRTFQLTPPKTLL